MKKIKQASESSIVTFTIRILSVILLALMTLVLTEIGSTIKGTIIQTYTNTNNIKIVTELARDNEGKIKCIQRVVRSKHPDVQEIGL